MLQLFTKGSEKMKLEFAVKWGFVFLINGITYALYHYVGTIGAGMFALAVIVSYLWELQKDLVEIRERVEEDKELWKAILPQRRRF